MPGTCQSLLTGGSTGNAQELHAVRGADYASTRLWLATSLLDTAVLSCCCFAGSG